MLNDLGRGALAMVFVSLVACAAPSAAPAATGPLATAAPRVNEASVPASGGALAVVGAPAAPTAPTEHVRLRVPYVALSVT